MPPLSWRSFCRKAIGCTAHTGLVPNLVLVVDPLVWKEAKWDVVNRKTAGLAWPGEQETSATMLSPVPRSQPSELVALSSLVQRLFQQLEIVNAAGRICPKTLPQEFMVSESGVIDG